jgi:hypothetical protein
MLTMTLQVLEGQARYVRNGSGRLFASVRACAPGEAVWSATCVGTGTFVFHVGPGSSSTQAPAAVELYPPGLLMLMLLRIHPAFNQRKFMAFFRQQASTGWGAERCRRCLAKQVRSLRQRRRKSRNAGYQRERAGKLRPKCGHGISLNQGKKRGARLTSAQFASCCTFRPHRTVWKSFGHKRRWRMLPGGARSTPFQMPPFVPLGRSIETRQDRVVACLLRHSA